GADNDPSDIDAVASSDVTFGGDDQITIGSTRAIVIGGKGKDTIQGGPATSVMLGDSGAVYAAAANPGPFGDLPSTLGLVQTVAPETGDDDTIQTGTGSSVIFGGSGNDTISTVLPTDVPNPNNTNFVVGDNGAIAWTAGELLAFLGLAAWPGADVDPSDIDLVTSTDFTYGGDDHITIGSGRAIVIGGKGRDTIQGGSTTSVMLGDSGAIYAASSNSDRFGDLAITLGMVQTLAPETGDDDTIQTGTGSSVIVGGSGNDTISTVL